MYILGINGGHNSTAALLKDGVIIGCVSEERFKRIKNYAGFPEESIRYLLSCAGITAQQLDLITLGYTVPPPFVTVEKKGAELFLLLHKAYFSLRYLWGRMEDRLTFLRPLSEFFYDRVVDIAGPIIIRREKKLISEKLGVPVSRIREVEHHSAHAYSAYYASSMNKEKALVFTLDGEGDKLCATVNIFEGASEKRIASTHLGHSIGWIYMDTTQFLGMKPNEHEYKVMGLAPYAKAYGTEKVYALIRDIIDLDKRNPLVFKSKFDTHRTVPYFLKVLKFQRFDFVASAVQKLTEDVVTRWIQAAVQKTGIRKICLGGGVFMNVKLNMRIMELPEVEQLFIMPSAGDESTPIGACLYGYKKLCEQRRVPFSPQPLKEIYLGPEFSEREIEDCLEELVLRINILSKIAHIEKEIARL